VINMVMIRPTEAGSIGGKRRAERLSADERHEIASIAARARWNPHPDAPKILKATHGSADHPLRIGDIEIPCYVLEDRRRVLSLGGMVQALGMSKGGGAGGKQGDKLYQFCTGRAVRPFISTGLLTRMENTLRFRAPSRGFVATGYEATILPDLCDAVLAAREGEKLRSDQLHIAKKCEILVRGFARVGIIALIDEVTGYQEVRARDELHKILEAYIAKELLPWTKRFPDEFFKEMFRVWGWPWPPASTTYLGPRGPRYAGKLVRSLIYENLPPGVLKRLDEVNPADKKWQRRNRLSQILTPTIGQVHLDKLVAQMTMLFRVADDPNSFWRIYKKAFQERGKQVQSVQSL
jgi:P63C domain